MKESKRATISFVIVFFSFIGLLYAPIPENQTETQERAFVSHSDIGEDWEYLYRADVERVVDGDTVDVILYLGLSVSIKTRLRLYGINAPEVTGEEKAAGKAATIFLKGLIDGKPLIVKTHKDKQGKYGRYLGTIYLKTKSTLSVNELMVKEGHAVVAIY